MNKRSNGEMWTNKIRSDLQIKPVQVPWPTEEVARGGRDVRRGVEVEEESRRGEERRGEVWRRSGGEKEGSGEKVDG